MWWSKDTAGYGGASEGLPPSAYKLFIKTTKIFQWIADVDENGNIIYGKKKGKIGKALDINDCWKIK